MFDWQKRDQFDRIWYDKLKSSKFDLENSFDFVTSAQCKEGMRLGFRTVDNEQVFGILRKKPSYTDSYGKARHRGFLQMELSPGEFFVAHTDKVMTKEKGPFIFLGGRYVNQAQQRTEAKEKTQADQSRDSS